MMLSTLALALVLAQPPKEADKAAQMSEDVEVMRRLLNKALGVPNEVAAIDTRYFSLYDLTGVQNRAPSVEYRPVAQLKEYIRNPAAFRYGNMPAHEYLTPADLDGLVAYFNAMKDRKHDPGGRP